MKRSGDKGFTMVEMLAALFVLSLILIFVFHSSMLLKYDRYSAKMLDRMEWELFVSQTKMEIRSCDKIRLTYNRILLYKGDSLIYYERWGSYLRRRVNGKGHEIMLYNVRSFAFEPVPQGIKIRVVRDSGETHEEEIFLPRPVPVEAGE